MRGVVQDFGAVLVVVQIWLLWQGPAVNSAGSEFFDVRTDWGGFGIPWGDQLRQCVDTEHNNMFLPSGMPLICEISRSTASVCCTNQDLGSLLLASRLSAGPRRWTVAALVSVCRHRAWQVDLVFDLSLLRVWCIAPVHLGYPRISAISVVQGLLLLIPSCGGFDLLWSAKNGTFLTTSAAKKQHTAFSGLPSRYPGQWDH